MSDNLKNLLAVLEAIEKIERYSAPFDNDDDFFHQELNFDATMMQFVVIGEMVEKIDNALKEKHSEIPWREIKDFRNIVAHDYFGVDSEEIWSIIKTHLPELKEKIQKIILYLQQNV